MPIYLDTSTNVIVDYPENIFEHPVLGKFLVPYTPGDECYEEDKVVVEAPQSDSRVLRTARLKDEKLEGALVDPKIDHSPSHAKDA